MAPGNGKHEIPFIVKYLDSALTVSVETHEGVVSPALPTSHSSDPTLFGPGIPNFGRGSAEGCADKDEINASPPTPPLIHFVLGNFFFATFLISLIISIIFFAVTWFTIFHDARLMRDQALSNANGVSHKHACILQSVGVANGRHHGRYQYLATASSLT